MNSCRQLDATRRLCGDGAAEERRRERAHVAGIVHSIDDVERVDARPTTPGASSPLPAPALNSCDHRRSSERRTGPLQRVTRDTGGAGVGLPGPVLVAAGLERIRAGPIRVTG